MNVVFYGLRIMFRLANIGFLSGLSGRPLAVLENLSAMAATTTGGAGATATTSTEDRVVTTTTTTMNAGFDALDLSNNRITELSNFPRLPRVTALYCSHNQIGANQLAILVTTSQCLQHLFPHLRQPRLLLRHHHLLRLLHLRRQRPEHRQ